MQTSYSSILMNWLRKASRTASVECWEFLCEQKFWIIFFMEALASMQYHKISDPGHYWPGPPLWDIDADLWGHCLCWVNVFWLDIRSWPLLIHLPFTSIYHFIFLCCDCFHMSGPRLHRPTHDGLGGVFRSCYNGLRQSWSPRGCISGGDTEACWLKGGWVLG